MHIITTHNELDALLPEIYSVHYALRTDGHIHLDFS